MFHAGIAWWALPWFDPPLWAHCAGDLDPSELQGKMDVLHKGTMGFGTSRGIYRPNLFTSSHLSGG